MTASVVPVSRVICGVPVKTTVSLKVIVMGISSPIFIFPLLAVEESDRIAGAALSNKVSVFVLWVVLASLPTAS